MRNNRSRPSPFPPNLSDDYPRITTPPPGPRAREIIARDARSVSQNLSKDVPLVVGRAGGMVVEDVDGNRFLDFAAGISTVSTGHCHPEVVEAVARQAESLIHICYTDFYYPIYLELCEELARIAPMRGSKRVFLANSGAEAVETAVKLARVRTGRQKIVGFFGAFHGRTYGAMTLTASKTVQRTGYGPLVPDILHTHYSYCYRCPVNRRPESCSVECLNLLSETHLRTTTDPAEVAAVIVEPIQGEGGFIPPHRDFLPKLQELCRRHGILLIADEVQSGMGRTGRMFALEHYGIDPDMILLAKGIASGMPIAAVIARDDVMKWNDGGHGSTFGGNPVSCASALATLRLLGAGLIDNARSVGAHLIRTLRQLQEKHPRIGEVRGLGLMVGIEVVADRQSRAPDPEARGSVIRRAFERGLLTLPCGASTIRLSPPLVATRSDVDKAVSILDAAFSEVD
ncbi:MAG: acetyl ornithine aminotransferase family protein [Acidobacteriota bacterium]